MYHPHLTTAKNLLLAYQPGVPLNFYLKLYFRQNKKHGSKDRKLISALCYAYFRLGFAFKEMPLEERILTGFFLCEHTPSAFLNALNSRWNNEIARPLNEKIDILHLPHQATKETEKIFSFKDALSKEMDKEKFSLSFLHQPKLFIRIRPGCHAKVLQKLQAKNITYEAVSENCIALPNSSKIEAVIDLDREAVVQDYNSQRVGKFLKLAMSKSHPAINVWDCCAASGGKSIMAYDIDPSIKLTVSDKRAAILDNLKKRFTTAGIKNYHSFVAGLPGVEANGNAIAGFTGKKYDLIIADVPCTGSGTWARTPEQLFYFNQRAIKRYSGLQRQIIENVIRHLKPGGFLLYITCSVFKKENEEVVNFIGEKLALNTIKMELLKGYEMQADTMFAALFSSPES